MFLMSLLLATMAQDPPVTPPGVLMLSGRVVGPDGRPVVGAEVLLSGIGGTDAKRPVLARGRSDAEGRFRVSVPAETDASRANLPLALWGHRPGMAAGGVGVSRQKPPGEGAVVVKLGPAEGHVDVRVLGPDGAPVAGATVVPRTLRIEGGFPPTSTFPPPDELAARMTARTDAEGKGRMADVVPQADPVVQVDSPAFGLQGGAFPADGAGIMKVTLAPAGRVSGRVLADDPATARDRIVIAFTRPAAPGPGAAMGEARVTTDSEGRFEIPALAAGQLALNVLVPAGSGLSPKLPLDKKVEPDRATEVEIRLNGPGKLRTVAGRVVDHRGEPVAGATVSQSGDAPARTQAEADAEGKFTLPGVAAGRTFLFVRAAGFRFAGRAIAPEDDDVTLTVTREGETPPAMVTLSPALSHAEELAMARRVLDPYAGRVLVEGGESEKIQLIEVLARTDPARVLELIEKKTFSASFLNDMLRMRVAAGLRDDAPDEASAVVESMVEPSFRAMALVAASDALPAAARAQKLDLLARAAVDARGSKDPSFKLSTLGLVAERWLDLGETDRGAALLREGAKVASELPDAGFAGYARGAFAEELAQVDLEAALALTKDLSDPHEFDRHHGNIAHELAGRNPAAAERVLAMVRDQFQRDQYAVRVIYRMARVDLGRARRLAGAIKDVSLRGYALGMAALGLAEADKRADAVAMLDEAFTTLARASEEGGVRSAGLFEPAAVAATLLPVAERADPRLVHDLFWRALSFRTPRPRDDTSYDPNMYTDIKLALMLARYDRVVARSLLEPYVGPDAPATVRIGVRGLPFASAAVVDPRRGVELVEALPDDPDLKAGGSKNAARLAVAQVLARRGEGRWRYLLYHHLHLWVPDVEDIAPDL